MLSSYKVGQFLENTNNNSMLVQLKIDFIQYMAQTGLILGYDSSLLSVIYTLLIENTYITQEQIMKLTGLRKRVVSNILSELSDPSSSFHVLKTRKPGEKVKYYKISFSYDQYIQHILILGLRAFKSNIEGIPILISRLDHLSEEKASVKRVRDFLSFFYRIMKMYSLFVEYSARNVEDLFQDNDFLESITEKLEAYFDEIPKGQAELVPDEDSLAEIKKDWLEYLQNFFAYSINLGKRRIESGQVVILHLLHMENEALDQTKIMKITGYSRGSVSEILSELVKSNTVLVVKHGRDRKKYFKLNIDISTLIIAKYTRLMNTYSQIHTMIQNRFLNDLQGMYVERTNKSHIERLFLEIIRLYIIAEKHLSHLVNFLKEKKIE
ncbi:MAG: hypothetical protein ACXABU_12825 [Candidatus Hodarchaeales archaeon]|jgi:DNA-binding transcriptional regulator GbsR (MarR family)